MFGELVAGLSNLSIGLINLFIGQTLGNFSFGNIIIGLFLTALGLLFLRLGQQISKKIKKLEQEKIIME